MIDIMKQAFWVTATQLTELIVPIVAITIIFSLFFAGLYGGRRR